MKAIITGLLLFLAAGAFAQRGVQTPPLNQNTSKTDVKGVVHYDVVDKNCPLYIEIVEGNQTVKYFPINLPAEFLVDMKKVRFDYTISSENAPVGCNFDGVIDVSNVKNQKLGRN